MDEKYPEHDPCADAVDDGRATRSAHPVYDRFCPVRFAVKHRHPAQDERHDAQRKYEVRDAPAEVKAPEMLALPAGQFFRQHVRPRFASLTVLVLPIEPQQRVRPEERKHGQQERGHEFRCNPQLRIALEILRVAVRLERDKTCSRALMALLAGLKAVVRIHRGAGVVYALDAVTAVAVETRRSMSITERDDLAMVGSLITLGAVDMAVAAILRNDQLGH